MTDGTVTVENDQANLREAIVLVGHGSHEAPQTAGAIHRHADRLRARGIFDAVKTGFWKEEPSLRNVLRAVDAESVYVVPVMTSEGYFTDEVFPRELGISDELTPAEDARVEYTDPIGTHDAMADVIVRRAETLIGDPTLGQDVGLAVVGHGTERQSTSGAATRAHANRISNRGRFAEVHPCFLDEPPFVGDVVERFEADEVVIVPFFVADGSHATVDIPAALGIPAGTDQQVSVEGRRVWYAGAVGTSEAATDVIVKRAVEAGAHGKRHSDRGDPDRLGPAERAFVNRFEADSATSVTRAWGELAITAHRDNGDRTYDVRHGSDVGKPPARLDELTTPAAVRDEIRTDDDWTFRPLRGERTLPSGWVLSGCTADELVRTVEFVYPTSVTNWHRERIGNLNVTHFEEAAARQTGIYQDIGEIDETSLSRLWSSICASCVKRRAWDRAADESTDTAGGEAAIPCREPCSVFLEAARQRHDEQSMSPPTERGPGEQRPSQTAGVCSNGGDR